MIPLFVDVFVNMLITINVDGFSRPRALRRFQKYQGNIIVRRP